MQFRGIATPKMERAMTNPGAALERIDFEPKQQSRSARSGYLQTNWDSLLRVVLSAAVGVVLIAVLAPGAWFDRQHMLEATIRMLEVGSDNTGPRTTTTRETSRTRTTDTYGTTSALVSRKTMPGDPWTCIRGEGEGTCRHAAKPALPPRRCRPLA